MPCVPEVSLETNKEEPDAKEGSGPDQPKTAWSAIKGQKGKKRKKILNISYTGEWTSNATVFHPSRRVIASCATQGLEKQLLPCIGSGSVNDGSFFLESSLAVAVEIEKYTFLLTKQLHLGGFVL